MPISKELFKEFVEKFIQNLKNTNSLKIGIHIWNMQYITALERRFAIEIEILVWGGLFFSDLNTVASSFQSYRELSSIFK